MRAIKFPKKKLILAILFTSAYLLVTIGYQESKLFDHYGKFSFSLTTALIKWSKPHISVLGLINDMLVFHLIWLIFFRQERKIILEEERIFQAFSAFGKLILLQPKSVDAHERTSLLLLILKLYYLPMMLGFSVGNFGSMSENFNKLITIDFSKPTLNSFNNNLIPVVFYALIWVDTICFTLGYATESKRLGNMVKSVETNPIGWIATLVCYYPLVKFSPVQFFGWHSSEFASFKSPLICAIFNCLSIWLFVIYTWSSIALGFKASNLTSRGVVSRGPYQFVRHPAYSSKCLSWWLMSIPFFAEDFFRTLGCMLSITAIYVIRALTEERHLNATDPQYKIYKKNVRNRFIPSLI